MPKNILHDFKTREERSIRRIPLPGGRRGAAPAEEDILYEREEIEVEETGAPRSGSRLLLWGAAAVFIILLLVTLSSSFTGARIRVMPKVQEVFVRTEFTATREEAGRLGFQALPINETAQLVIPADTQEKVSERATGTIVIYNVFSDKPQRLIRNTRFETPAGLIYRIGTSVIVPGRVVRDGKSVPGSVEAVVSADSPGAEYNVSLSDFTIPGFKTDPPRFAGFYARTKTPIEGGKLGVMKTPSEGAVKTARASLQESLRQRVEKEKQALVPSGYVLFQGASATREELLSTESQGENKAAVRQRIVGAAYIFKKSDIAKAIAEALIPAYDKLPVEIANLDSLVFKMTGPTASSLSELKTLRFTLTGNARIVWHFEAEKLREALAGKPRNDLSATLVAFPMIAKADLVLKPFWSKKFPKNPKHIVIETIFSEGTAPVTKPN